MSEREKWTDNDLNVEDLHRLWAENDRYYRREKMINRVAWIIALTVLAFGTWAMLAARTAPR